MPDRFCGECGAPLTPGARFCEECGQPVTTGEEPGASPPSQPVPVPALPSNPVHQPPSRPVQSPPSGPVPASQPAVPDGPERILAVLPFCSRPKGFLGSEQLSVVFTSRRVVPVVWDDRQRSVLAMLQKTLSRQVYDLGRKGGDPAGLIAPLVFGAGTVHPSWDQMYPNIGGVPGTPLQEIEYIRGEQADSAHFHEDLLVISTPAGEQQLTVEAGWYTATVSRLLPLIWEAMGGAAGEQFLGVIPFCSEPEREGFGFAYSFSLVVTTGRIIYAFISDDFADTQAEYFNRILKARGIDEQQLNEEFSASPPSDAPWQSYLMQPPDAIFAEDPINFYIPCRQVWSATVTMGKRNKRDLLVLALPSHEERLALDPGFGNLAYTLLSRALGNGRVRKL